MISFVQRFIGGLLLGTAMSIGLIKLLGLLGLVR